MSVPNPERLATKQDLKDMYDRIRPYMGGLVTSKAGFTPIGTIISVMGTTAPVNYLACDGTVYNIADYTELANYFNEQFGSTNFFGGNGTTTFAVPDLRGEFLRGTGTNSHENQGSGDSVGVHQDGTIHLYTGGETTQVRSAPEYVANVDYQISTGNTGAYVGGNSGASYFKFTSRPTNTSVLYCIATKNFYIDPTLDYSTDEKIVGTWIDGKPVWQKTFAGNLTTDGAWNDFAHNISNLDEVIDFRYAGKRVEDGIYWSFGAKGGQSIDTSTALQFVVTSTMLRVWKPSSDINSFTATLQYTKTTT